jgi:hypothetical protein
VKIPEGNNPHMALKLKGETKATVDSITERTLAAVMQNFSTSQ